MSSVVQNLLPQFTDVASPDNDAHEELQEEKIGSVIMEGGYAGAEIWAYVEDDDTWLEFQGWRSDGSRWCFECNIEDSVEETLQTFCHAANDLDRAPEYIRVTAINYTVNMPDCALTRDATLNQCMDFPDQHWIDVRNQEQWYDVHMVVRIC